MIYDCWAVNIRKYETAYFKWEVTTIAKITEARYWNSVGPAYYLAVL